MFDLIAHKVYPEALKICLHNYLWCWQITAAFEENHSWGSARFVCNIVRIPHTCIAINEGRNFLWITSHPGQLCYCPYFGMLTPFLQPSPFLFRPLHYEGEVPMLPCKLLVAECWGQAFVWFSWFVTIRKYVLNITVAPVVMCFHRCLAMQDGV